MAFLRHVSEKGVVSMEMEALVFAAMTHLAGIRSAVVCVTFLDRLQGDQASFQDSFNTIFCSVYEYRDIPIIIVSR
jgi:uridine phosphorylase